MRHQEGHDAIRSGRLDTFDNRLVRLTDTGDGYGEYLVVPENLQAFFPGLDICFRVNSALGWHYFPAQAIVKAFDIAGNGGDTRLSRLFQEIVKKREIRNRLELKHDGYAYPGLYQAGGLDQIFESLSGGIQSGSFI